MSSYFLNFFFFLLVEMDPMEHIKKQNKYVLKLFMKFDFVFINY